MTRQILRCASTRATRRRPAPARCRTSTAMARSGPTTSSSVRLDPARRDVPQADLQRTLLLRVVEWLTAAHPAPPVALPGGAPAVAFLDGDSDSMALEDFRLALATCERYGAPFGTYLKPEHVDLLEAGEVRAPASAATSSVRTPGPVHAPQWRKRGRAGGKLPGDGRQVRLQAAHHPQPLADLAGLGGPRSVAGDAGITLDANFTAGYAFKGGYVNGTGLPAWFVDERPALDVFEQSTISTDDGWLLPKGGLPAHTLAAPSAVPMSRLTPPAERYHTVFHPYFHPVSLKGGRAMPYPTLPWMESILAHCRRLGLPFLDAERWVDWNLARRAVTLASLEHDGDGALRCALTASLRWRR